MLGSPAGPGGPSQRGLWPLAPAPSATSFTADGLSKYGVYSLFPGGPGFGGALYSHASTIGRFASGHIQQSSGNTFHTAHKVSDSLFSTAGYTFGAPTPPPGSPYSPIPLTPLDLLAKGFNSSIIIQQPDYLHHSPKKLQIQETNRCEEKCCCLKAHQKTATTCSNCQIGSVKGGKFVGEIATGCSRTNPIEWGCVNVKKEPGATPCQVPEISTSASPVVKLEVTSPKTIGDANHNSILSNSLFNANGSHIPIGVAVARQRLQEIVASPSLPSAGLLTTVNTAAHIKEISRISEIDSTASVGSMAANSPGGGTMLHCTDDRAAGLATWPMGGANQTLTTPTLWQYPAPVPMEPMVPLPVPMPPVGFQLVRDPNTGGLLLLPTTGIEPLQQTVVWPSYTQASPVLLPSLPPLPPPPLQLLSSASSDYLSSTTLHQHTQTHSTRLVAVTTDNKRKIPLPIPTTTLIKIETDATTLDQTKTLQAMSTISTNTGTVFTDPNMTPLVTTHVIYQHPTNLILSQNPTATEPTCQSQATSPVTCLTPPPDTVHYQDETVVPSITSVQDAGNQTETPICSEDDDNTSPATPDVQHRIQYILENKSQENASINRVPDKVTDDTEIEVEIETPVSDVQEKPDLSGLELLSNSIVEFESCRKTLKEEPAKPIEKDEEVLNKEIALEKVDTPKVSPQKVDDSLGGLDLLCALAEQRILEEKNVSKREKHRSKERRREKRKSKKHSSSDEPRRKKQKSDKHSDSHNSDSNKKHDKYLSDSTRKEQNVEEEEDKRSCSCRSYKTPESEEEVRKFIASKSSYTTCCKGGDWPCMNAMELDMRMKLADLQRQYREKQKELSKLKPKKHSQECSKRKSRKKSTNSERSLTPPPRLDKMDLTVKPKQISELLKPPTLCAMPKIDEKASPIQHPILSSSDQDSSPEKFSSSQKRKVGRPKKLMSSSGLLDATETIVAKKPKSNFVGYLLAAKEKFKNRPYSESPPRYLDESSPVKLTRNNNVIVDDDNMKLSKMRPKLKAEATIKSYIEEEQEEKEEVALDEDVCEEEDMDIEEANDQVNEKISQEDNKIEDKVEIVTEVKPEDTRCILTAEHLETDKLRVLTAMGGLFYAGHLNAVQPPDVYSITLDGERGNRPHIMSREEILRDAIIEVSPKSTNDLPVGTRLCAYWSQQYRCLYPGSVAEPGTPNPELDAKFVSVEFDDGDSGRIALEDIRFLTSDYPIIEYDPNPLLSLSKRRRRTSTSVSIEERRQSVQAVEREKPQLLKEPTIEKDTNDENKPQATERYKEKKRLKKKKREKLKQKQLLHPDNTNKKKKKKHKCNDENCRHKKHHKKHRKHKKHHDKKQVAVMEEVNQKIEPEPVVVKNEEPVVEKMVVEEEFNNEPDIIANPEDEVTMDDIIEATQSNNKSKKIRDRQESCESRSKMSAFLPARQLWGWLGKGYKRQRAKGRSKKSFYKSIQRGKETITVGDSAVFLSTGRPDRPYIGRIEAMWEFCGTMVVKVKWFYHPEETTGCPLNLQYPGALFESPHVDENDVQTISHKCEVLPLKEYTERLGDDPQRYETIYDNNDIYYLAGYYDPIAINLKMEPGIPCAKTV